MPNQADIDKWFQQIDGLAVQASADLGVVARQAEAEGSPRPMAGSPPRLIADALLAIASQLAYGNAVAAAEFYVHHYRTSSKEAP